MEGLPANLVHRLQALLYEERAVAWLLVDSELALAGGGGRLEHYGLTPLRLGQPAAEQAWFLEGLLPLAEPSCCVPAVELVGGRATDLHLHLDGGSTWVLLLDATAARDATRRVQQKAHDMTLLQEKEAVLNRKLEAANLALAAAHRELEASHDLVRRELRRKQLELAEARTLQLALVPPSFSGSVGGCALTVDVVLQPANEVGGDLVDCFCIEDDLLVLVLGDVSDKGAGAALMMARTHALIRSLVARPDAAGLFRAPERAVHLVNAALSAGNSGCMFVTLLLAVFDGGARRLTYTRAGHVPPFLHRAHGAIERLDALGGLPLGLLEDAHFTPAVVDLEQGDELLIVTDGFTEAMDPSQNAFGDDRVEAVVVRRRAAQGLLSMLLAGVRAFEAGSPPADDMAAILLRIGTP